MTYQYKPGLGNVASYQASGKPFATGSINCAGTAGRPAPSTVRVDFPYVTSWVSVTNADSTGAQLRVGFSQLGVQGGDNNNYFSVLSGSAPLKMDLKVTSLFLSGSDDVTVVAGLTGIPKQEIANNWTGSTGVG
jgi:hypothetical protein